MTRSSSQEREYQRRRQEKWDERQHRRQARRRQVVVVVGILLVIAAVVLVLVLNQPDDGPAEPAATPTPDVVAPTAEPDEVAPLPTTDPELYDTVPDPAGAEGRTWQLTLETNQGPIGVELDGVNAPQATASFLHLAREGFYDGTGCHRLLPDALLQCGDPTATGTGGPGYSYGPVENAPEDDVYPPGTLAMARQGNNGESMGSQFFLVFASVPLPADQAGGYTVFGQVTEGLDILQQVGSAGTVPGSEQPTLPVTIEGVTIS
ncbi:peptidylprolyl isomerase [Georgenia sunbinii]|uniref:peptidylprolyl isomerase n=1 Tax=Georgenia sunbinii TaxID=3117728 RepID=UPI002F263B3C